MLKFHPSGVAVGWDMLTHDGSTGSLQRKVILPIPQEENMSQVWGSTEVLEVLCADNPTLGSVQVLAHSSWINQWHAGCMPMC